MPEVALIWWCRMYQPVAPVALCSDPCMQLPQVITECKNVPKSLPLKYCLLSVLTSKQGLCWVARGNCLRTCGCALACCWRGALWSSCLEATAREHSKPTNRGTVAAYRGHTYTCSSDWLALPSLGVYTLNSHSKVYLFSSELQLALWSTL